MWMHIILAMMVFAFGLTLIGEIGGNGGAAND